VSKFISSKKHRVIVGYDLKVDGTKQEIVTPVSRVRHHMKAPVSYGGAPCVLYFLNYYRSIGANSNATHIFNYTGFHIYGPAVLETHVETWHCIRVRDSEANVKDKIAHLTLGAHAVVPTSRRDTHQDVIAKSEVDIVMLRLALSA
jgi:hypothetical protein